MKKNTFTIDMVCADLNNESVVKGIQEYLDQNHSDAVSQVKATGVKTFSEQGFKVWRARVTGVTAKQAGDAHNPKAEAV